MVGGLGRISSARRHSIGAIARAGALGLAIALSVAACADSPEEPSADTAPEGPTRDAAPADIGRVVCDAEGTRVETPTVRARPDGVHLVVVNRLGFDSGFSMAFSDGAGIGENAPQGESAHVVTAPPGPVEIGCYLDPQAIGETQSQPFEVVDPDAVYRSTELDCDSRATMNVDYAPDAPGQQGDPVDVAREWLEKGYGLTGDDVVESGGYPEAKPPIARLLRDGRVLATLELLRAANDGWLVSTATTCGDLRPA